MIQARQVDKLGEEKCIQHFVGNYERKKQLEDLNLNGRTYGF